MTFFTMTVLLSAAALLAVSLLHGSKLYRRTMEFSGTWALLLGLIVLLILGYLTYATIILDRGASTIELLIALVFLGGSCYVWLVNTMSQTVVDKMTRLAALERHRANHDDLTALPKRSFFVTYLDDAIRGRERDRPKQAAIIMMDLDRFKLINDTMGHYYGDILLKEVALRLHRSIRRTDMLARLGGDDFGVFIDPVTDPFHVKEIAQHIVSALEEPFAVEGQPADVGISLGIAWFPDHGADSVTLLKHAKASLLEAKRTQADVVTYHKDMVSHDPDQLNIISELRSAIEQDQLVVHYQPQLEVKTGKICSVEALVRWPHPRLGLLSPDEFIPLAEENGLINHLNYWVLDIVLLQLSRWELAQIELPISTNVSALNLQDKKFHDYIVTGFNKTSVSPRRLKLEITETALMRESNDALTVIRDLTKLGVTFSIDDFGTGYSSFDYLKNFPVDEIKIDKSFVMNLNKEGDDALIIRSTIELAHKMRRSVVAEGVESKDAFKLLKRWGCDKVQGFYVSQPLDIDGLNTLLNKSKSEDA